MNARHTKSVPGRITIFRDAMWPWQLNSHGSIRASFQPDQRIAELYMYFALEIFCPATVHRINNI